MPCCSHDACSSQPLADTQRHRRVLWTVLVINLVVFGGEFAAGWFARSSAVQDDSLDSLGDALVYGISLMVVGGSLRARAMSAVSKGVIQLLFGAAVLVEVTHCMASGIPPMTGLMALAALSALIGNRACLLLLTPLRSDDINMASVWKCSRNEVIGNAGVLITAGIVAISGRWWLDILFGGQPCHALPANWLGRVFGSVAPRACASGRIRERLTAGALRT